MVFTALHAMQTRSSDENSVRLSVRLSHAWIVTKRKKDMSRFLYHTKLLQVSSCENCQRQSCKAFIGVTNRAKIIGGGRTLLPEILDQIDRVGANRRFSISFRS